MIRPILQSQNKLRIPITNKTNFKPVLSLNFPGVLAGHDNRVSCLGVTEVTAFLMIPCHLLFAFVCGIFGSWILGRKNSRHRSMGLLHSSLCPSYRHWNIHIDSPVSKLSSVEWVDSMWTLIQMLRAHCAHWMWYRIPWFLLSENFSNLFIFRMAWQWLLVPGILSWRFGTKVEEERGSRNT